MQKKKREGGKGKKKVSKEPAIAIGSKGFKTPEGKSWYALPYGQPRSWRCDCGGFKFLSKVYLTKSMLANAQNRHLKRFHPKEQAGGKFDARISNREQDRLLCTLSSEEEAKWRCPIAGCSIGIRHGPMSNSSLNSARIKHTEEVHEVKKNKCRTCHKKTKKREASATVASIALCNNSPHAVVPVKITRLMTTATQRMKTGSFDTFHFCRLCGSTARCKARQEVGGGVTKEGGGGCIRRACRWRM